MNGHAQATFDPISPIIVSLANALSPYRYPPGIECDLLTGVPAQLSAIVARRWGRWARTRPDVVAARCRDVRAIRHGRHYESELLVEREIVSWCARPWRGRRRTSTSPGRSACATVGYAASGPPRAPTAWSRRRRHAAGRPQPGNTRVRRRCWWRGSGSVHLVWDGDVSGDVVYRASAFSGWRLPE
jgi:hypothetical protein